MLNRDKIRTMTKLAIYEKHHRDAFRIDKYYKSDYVFWHVLLAAARFTFCFLVYFALFVFFNSERLFYNINLSGITETIKKFLVYYAAGLAGYCVISAAVYIYRYKRARKDVLVYAARLERLARRYHYFDEEF